MGLQQGSAATPAEAAPTRHPICLNGPHVIASRTDAVVLARDGQQYGPLSDTELAKFVELGHLQPTDLLWREGFPDWRPAMVVFPPRKPAMQRPAADPSRPGPMAQHAAPARGPREQPMPRQAQMPRAAVARQSQAPRESYPEPEEAAPRRKGLKRALVVILCLAALGAGGWYAYGHSEKLLELMNTLVARLPAGLLDRRPARAKRQGTGHFPAQGFRAAPDALDPDTAGNAALARPQARLSRLVRRAPARRSPLLLPRTRMTPPSASRWRARWWRCAARKSATRSAPASRN